MNTWKDLLQKVRDQLSKSEKELDEEREKYTAISYKHARSRDALDNIARKMFEELKKKNNIDGTTCTQNITDVADQLAYQADEQKIPFPTSSLFLYLDEE